MMIGRRDELSAIGGAAARSLAAEAAQPPLPPRSEDD